MNFLSYPPKTGLGAMMSINETFHAVVSDVLCVHVEETYCCVNVTTTKRLHGDNGTDTNTTD